MRRGSFRHPVLLKVAKCGRHPSSGLGSHGRIMLAHAASMPTRPQPIARMLPRQMRGGPTCLRAMRGQYLDRRALVALVRPDVSVTRSASNRGSLQSYRPRLPPCRKDRSNHQSNSRLTRRYPSRSPHRLSPPNVGTPLRGCHRRICPPQSKDPGGRRPAMLLIECYPRPDVGVSPSRIPTHPGSSWEMGDANSVEAMGFGWSGGILRPSGHLAMTPCRGRLNLRPR
jgi:hypothetical protein